ncbi:MAG: hypothetical protein AAGL98_09910, partial [Planctomycetota bacterium]
MQLRFVDRWMTGLRLTAACLLALSTAWGSAVAAPHALAWSADLPAVSDGRHLWTWAQDVDESNDQPRLS